VSPARQGCARRPQAVPEGDEREGANLEQPDSGESRWGAQAMHMDAIFISQGGENRAMATDKMDESALRYRSKSAGSK